MFENILIWMADHFHEMKDKGNDCWTLINLTVPCKILNETYNKFLKEGIAPIENLTQEKKLFYYTIACKYYEETEERIKASKAAYTLALITSND